MRAAGAFLISAVSVISSISGDLKVVEFLPDPHGSDEAEYVVLGGDAAAGGALSLSDGHATVGLPVPSASDRVTLARNASAFEAQHGRPPDAEYGPRLRLGNAGGRLVLLRGGVPIDAVVWGAAAPLPGWEGDPLPRLPPGEIHVRRSSPSGLPADTDAAPDFAHARVVRVGQTRMAPEWVDARVVPFRSPEGALAALAAALADAEHEILVEGYLFSSPEVAALLSRAASRGVDVRLLLEADPVGGRPKETAPLLETLRAAGARVCFLGADGAAGRLYPSLHAKSMVIDGTRVVVGSETWTPTG
ncbi:MAG: phospholipase D-like domain-containing protein [Methanobacteriota archaeon]